MTFFITLNDYITVNMHTPKNQLEETTLLISAFRQLEEWRHLPAYQLERRVDVFFGLLLPKILKKETILSCEHKDIIPEFPLHKGSLYSSNSNLSYKVDFAAFCEGKDGKCLVLVELKTDNNSINTEQLEHIYRAKQIGVEELLDGVLKCSCHSKEQRKYAHLIQKLISKVACIRDPCHFAELDLSRRSPGLKRNFDALRERKDHDTVVCKGWPNATVKLMLIYPEKESKNLSASVKQNLKGWTSVDFNTVNECADDETLSQLLSDLSKCKAGWRTS